MKKRYIALFAFALFTLCATNASAAIISGPDANGWAIEDIGGQNCRPAKKIDVQDLINHYNQEVHVNGSPTYPYKIGASPELRGYSVCNLKGTTPPPAYGCANSVYSTFDGSLCVSTAPTTTITPAPTGAVTEPVKPTVKPVITKSTEVVASPTPVDQTSVVEEQTSGEIINVPDLQSQIDSLQNQIKRTAGILLFDIIGTILALAIYAFSKRK